MSLPAYAAETIHIVGSSTVYPFSASVAEHFGSMGDYRTPVVEATGTGAGLKLFCNGLDAASPPITNASRKILASEQQQCINNGIRHIIEVKFGYDGILFANAIAGEHFHLTRKQLFLALARFIPQNGKLVPNFYHKWSEIDTKLPASPIKVYGTPPVSGTYDTFIELVMKKGCEQIKDYETLIADVHEREKNCKMLREDGVFIEAGENGNLITQKLVSDPTAIGILGFSFMEQNHGKIQAATIDGKTPDFEAIQKGEYPISRPLFFYLKGDTLKNNPAIAEYTQEFMSEGAIGDEGYLVMQGLVPLPEKERLQVRQQVTKQLQNLLK